MPHLSLLFADGLRQSPDVAVKQISSSAKKNVCLYGWKWPERGLQQPQNMPGCPGFRDHYLNVCVTKPDTQIGML